MPCPPFSPPTFIANTIMLVVAPLVSDDLDPIARILLVVCSLLGTALAQLSLQVAAVVAVSVPVTHFPLEESSSNVRKKLLISGGGEIEV